MHRGALSLLYYVVNFPNSYSTEDLAMKNFFRLLCCFSLDSSKNFNSVLKIVLIVSFYINASEASNGCLGLGKYNFNAENQH